MENKALVTTGGVIGLFVAYKLYTKQKSGNSLDSYDYAAGAIAIIIIYMLWRINR